VYGGAEKPDSSLLSLISELPRTPMDLIQADFPSTPSSVYSNRVFEEGAEDKKEGETEGDVSKKEDEGDDVSKALEKLTVADVPPSTSGTYYVFNPPYVLNPPSLYGIYL
jgi:hypothetical protein